MQLKNDTNTENKQTKWIRESIQNVSQSTAAYPLILAT